MKWFHFTQLVFFYVILIISAYLLVHFDFVSASQSSLPVAAACASRHHTPTADARLSIAKRLPQTIWWRFYLKKKVQIQSENLTAMLQ